MDDPKEDAPEYLVVFVGHICGIIFIALTVFTCWTFYKLIIIKKALLLTLIIPSISITYFFGNTAIKLTTKKNVPIIPIYGFLCISIGLGFFSIITLVVIYKMIGNNNFSVIDIIIFAIATLVSLILSILFFNYFRKNKK